MDISKKQKRLQYWNKFIENKLISEKNKLIIKDLLVEYKNLLAKCWENEDASSLDLENIKNLERKIEQANEEAQKAC